VLASLALIDKELVTIHPLQLRSEVREPLSKHHRRFTMSTSLAPECNEVKEFVAANRKFKVFS